jgi:hypothetical protein
VPTPDSLANVRSALERREQANREADSELASAVRDALESDESVTAVAQTLGWTRRSVYLLLERHPV